MPKTMVDVAVLLSVGSHPASGRARRAPLDAQALELALRLTESGQIARIHALHAGAPSQPALRDYLGMGLDRLEVLETAPGADPVPALIARLRELSPAIILAGSTAEGGEDSGMVPYLIAQALNRTLIPDIVGIDLTATETATEAALTQALPRGQRRLVTASPPLVATLHGSAHAARQSAFARARRGTIETRPAATVHPDGFLAECTVRPWRARPKLMRVQRGGSALDRMKAATETKAGQGRLMVQPTPDEAAAAIYDCLIQQGWSNRE
jgi:electron transfer flavoprotein beta subunit